MNIYLGRLSRNVSESKIKELFEQFGPVSSIKIIKDKFTGSPKGFAFVEMEDEAAHEAIAALNGTDYDGQKIIVSEARPRENRDNRFSPRGGGDSRGGYGDSNGGGRSRFNNRF
jgi:RNA recognition motif-containing protein